MESKKNPSFPPIADEKFGRKTAYPSAGSSPSSPGYFSTVIPPASTVIAKDLSHSDLCWTLNKQRNEGRIANARSTNPGSPTNRQSTQNKDAKSTYPNEYNDSPYFGSSVNYGARDSFYASSSSTRTSKTSENKYRADEGADLGDIHVADRGEWWQGSLYY
ncbi:hypothetical protein Cni_G15692 [Canna indica]|uniref:Uncharacterized protein n=1 Tax=Canna indica TaxID=4628 RepID=A0AAQ3KE78_9LILI|nr:hypothetical protein Cni_G15692 [Canna indica]